MKKEKEKETKRMKFSLTTTTTREQHDPLSAAECERMTTTTTTMMTQRGKKRKPQVRRIADLEKMDAWQQLRLFQARERKRTSSVKFSLFRYVVIDAHL